jgi:hypothetical protein
MRTGSLFILIGSLVVAAGLPLVFLFRHPGKKMDENPYKHWLIGTSVAVVVGLAALVLYGFSV